MLGHACFGKVFEWAELTGYIRIAERKKAFKNNIHSHYCPVKLSNKLNWLDPSMSSILQASPVSICFNIFLEQG